MLNYFLKTLTGPDRKSFKVSNLDKYSFKPGEVVQKISKIYINLRDSKTFIKAISAEQRSYSPELFSWAENVLVKVSRADLDTLFICQAANNNISSPLAASVKIDILGRTLC